jgi:hypothetical protein
MGNMQHIYEVQRIFVINPERKKKFEKPRRKREDKT